MTLNTEEICDYTMRKNVSTHIYNLIRVAEHSNEHIDEYNDSYRTVNSKHQFANELGHNMVLS